MPPKRKAARNHATIPSRPRLAATTNDDDLTAPDGPQPVNLQQGRLIPEAEVEQLIQRAVQQGVEAACRQIFPQIANNTTATPAVEQQGPAATATGQASGSMPQMDEAVGEDTVLRTAIDVAATVSQVAPANDSDSVPFRSTAIPLPALVAQPIKDKIWAGEFIEISMIDKKDHESFEQVIKYIAGAPVVQWVPKHRTKTLSLDQWTNNFHIYATIYCEKKPEKFASLLKYMSIIRKLASKGADWQFYDCSFRRLQATNGDQGWERVEWELWHEAIIRKVGQSSTSAKHLSVPHPKGFCFKFLEGKPCPGPEGGCQHFHRCTTCQGNHHPGTCHGSSQAPRSHFGVTPNFRPQRFNFQAPSGRYQPYSPRTRGNFRRGHPYHRR
ncbi:uncharacterized protein LOC117319495 [Pecten maximus]|uniref:uncharacterized protein LOC117319495 n=1 Tax=Pecten maximus TaxID=6579 RepID=UPI001458560E|nr:uncharacterized protein LOC117319495 [Pecten maximus]